MGQSLRFLAVLALVALGGCGGADDTSAGPEIQDSGPQDKAEAAKSVGVGKADWTFDICKRRG